MKVVSETSPEELEARRKAQAREDAEAAFVDAVRSLTANLIRITRGAGKGYEVGIQAVDLVKSLEAYWDAFDHWPDEWAYQKALELREERESSYTTVQQRRDAISTIVRGSLQLAASRLLDQRMQLSRAEEEIFRGLRSYEEWKDEVRKELLAEKRGAKPSATRRGVVRKL